MDECLLVLIVTPAIENAVVDWLLDNDDIAGFSSAPINGHGVSEHSLTPAEQVAGRQKQIMFQMHVSDTAAEKIIDAARRTFSGSGIHYWVTSVRVCGNI